MSQPYTESAIALSDMYLVSGMEMVSTNLSTISTEVK